MNTKPWTPSSSSAGASTGAPGFNAAGQFDVIDKTSSSRMGLCGALYVVIACLRGKLPVQVLLDGEELFSFDGDAVNQTPEFGTLLTEFEYCLLSERREAESATMDYLERTIAQKSAQQPRGEAPRQQESGPTEERSEREQRDERDDRRRGGPNGRRR